MCEKGFKKPSCISPSEEPQQREGLWMQSVWEVFLAESSPHCAPKDSHWWEAIWLINVESPLAKILTLMCIKKLILERNPINVMNVENPSVEGLMSMCTRGHIVERCPTCVENVGRPLVTIAYIHSTEGHTRGRSLTSVAPVGKLSAIAPTSQFTGKFTRERLYQCGECGVIFSFGLSFTQHRWTHNGEKPYKCHQCGKAFNQGSNLIGHQRTHTKERKLTISF